MLFYFLWVNGIHESKESINEIARLIAGSNITEMTIEHAREIVSLTKENH